MKKGGVVSLLAIIFVTIIISFFVVQITIFAVYDIQTNHPTIQFVSPTPANGTVQTANSIYVNLSTSDANDHYAFVDFNRNLMLWMRMDEINSSGDPADISTYSNNGSAKNGAAQNASGKFNASFSFDGTNDYVNVPNSQSITFTSHNNFTFSAWIYPISNLGDRAIFEKGGVFDLTGWMALIQADQKFWFCTGGCNIPVKSTSNIISNQWWHVVGVKHGTTADIYVNSVLETANANFGNITNDSGVDALIGAYNYAATPSISPAGFFYGKIDEVLIFNRSLSASEVLALYNASANQYQNNFTNLSNGDHTFTGYAVDTAGNRNSTELRTVRIAEDIINPLIQFVSPTPANNAITTNTSVQINISITEQNLRNFIWNWNGTNYTFYNDSLVLMLGFNNLSAIGDNETNAVDVSRYGNNGTLKTGATWNTSGRYGNAVSFDGLDSYINVSRIISLEGSGAEYSISIWVKRDSSSTGYGNVIFTYDDNDVGNNDGTDIYFYWQNSGLGLRYNSGAGDEHTVSGVDLTDGNWHNLVIIKNSTNAKVYSNGILKETVSSASNLAGSSSHLFRIGFKLNVASWKGSMDEVRIWNRSLTSDEIGQQYRSNLAKYSTTEWNIYSNQTNLAYNRNYTYFGCATDISGNQNCTETRTTTVFNGVPAITQVILNTTNPATNDTDQNLTGYIIGASDSEEDNITFDYNWYKNGVLNATTLIDNGIALYAPLNNDTFDYASSNDGMAFGNPVRNDTYGKVGAGYGLDGDGDFLNFTRLSVLEGDTANYSVVMWVKSVSPAPTNDALWSYDRDDSMGNDNGNNDIYLIWRGSDLGFGQTTGCELNAGFTDLTDGNWHHLVFTASYVPGPTSVVKTYEDGVLKATQTSCGRHINGGSDFRFRIGDDLNVDYWNGSIDEVIIYNRSLNAAEVEMLYAGSRDGGSVMRSDRTVDGDIWKLGVRGGDYKNTFGSETNSSSVAIASTPPLIRFVSPTLANNAITTNTSVIINISITEQNLRDFIWNWNITNYTFYNDSLVLMMNLDNRSAIGENETHVKDVSRYANNGTLYKGVSWNTSGRYGSALSFDGVNDYVKIPDSNSLDFAGSQPFSISTWIYPKDTTVNIRHIIAKQSSAGNPNNYALTVWDDGHLKFYWVNGDNRINTDPDVLSPNTWYHVVGTWDGTYSKIYVNAINKSTVDYSTVPPLANSESLRIGIYGDEINYVFNGTIDEVRIWNRSLSADEIRQQYYSNLAKFNLTTWNFYTNQSNLTNGTYTYFGYAKDTAEISNQTETRTLVIGPDTLRPLVTIVSPTSTTYTVDNYAINIILDEAGYCEYSVNSSAANNTLTANSSNSGFTGTRTGVSNGAYTLRAYCNDTSGNRNYTSSVDFSVSVAAAVAASTTSGGAGGGAGGGGGTGAVYNVFENQLAQGYTIDLKANSLVNFAIGEEQHKLDLVSVNVDDILIAVSSTPEVAILKVNETKKFELTNDDYYDLKVRLNYVKAGKASITLTSIYEKIVIKVPIEAAPVPEITPEAPEEEKKFTTFNYIIKTGIENLKSLFDKYAYFIMAVLIATAVVILLVLTRQAVKKRRLRELIQSIRNQE